MEKLFSKLQSDIIYNIQNEYRMKPVIIITIVISNIIESTTKEVLQKGLGGLGRCVSKDTRRHHTTDVEGVGRGLCDKP